MPIETEAWVLHRAREGEKGPARLALETITLPDLTDDQMLVEPLYGCWEGNMTHAVLREPLDVCAMRGEEKVVLGNAGTVRVLEVGRAVRDVRPGDVAILSAIGSHDEHGFMIQAYAYDAPGTVGMLARRVVLRRENLLYVLRESAFSPREWAAFSLRFPTAWANWRLAFGAYRLQMTERMCPEPFVAGWGGGVTLAELLLARQEGCRVAMIASRPERLAQIRALGIEPIDRRTFPDLDFDEARYAADGDYRKAYRRSEEAFLDALGTAGGGRDVAVFLDHVGAPVFRATVKALGRQGVLATAGWRRGMKTTLLRAIECINHHLYVHTHGARAEEGIEAIEHGEATGWMPPLERETCAWRDVGELAEECIRDRVASYFPMFAVNAHAAHDAVARPGERRRPAAPAGPLQRSSASLPP
ncbi:MAG: zinc-binding alcohol dehydrogenase family protein [Thermodesulfobacteriota bacterium]